jgi:hypothetical protein
VWLVVSIVFSTFPSATPVTAETMNYSSVVMAGWMAFGTVYYFVWGRKKFEVPEVRMSDVVVGVQIPEK